MPYTIEKVPDVPVVVLVVDTKRIMQEVEALIADLTAVLDIQAEPVFLVLDVTEMAVSLEDLTSGASLVTRGPGALLHHPNVRENLMVSPDGMIKLTVKGLKTSAFGSVKMQVFDTSAQAFDYCREQLTVQQDN